MRILFFILPLILFSVQSFAQTGAPGTPPAATREVPQEPAAEKPVPQPRKIQTPENPLLREILIYAAPSDRFAITDFLKGKNLEMIEDYPLRSLESVLIITKGDQSVLQMLRLEFPKMQIDWNDDLSASGSPRLYAKDAIKWPDKGACLDKASQIPIGLIDGQINQTHPAFAGQHIFEKSFLDKETADQNHATAIASILLGNAPDQGFDGLLKGAKLYNAVALRHAPNDEQLASIAATLRGLDWLLGKDIRLINVSLAGTKNSVLIAAFEKSVSRGALIFAAAGNNGAGAPPAYPAAIDGVFAVTAIDVAGRPYKQANTGEYIDFSAPGVDIWVATPDGNGAYKSGTSYAAPYVMGAAALSLGKNPVMSSAVLLKLLRGNGAAPIAACL